MFKLRAVLLLSLVLCQLTARADETDAQRILAASDAVRNPGRSFGLTTTLLEYHALPVSVCLAAYALVAFWRPLRLAMFGLGGIFVEVLKDVVFRRCPFGEDEAERMIRLIAAEMRVELNASSPSLSAKLPPPWRARVQAAIPPIRPPAIVRMWRAR